MPDCECLQACPFFNDKMADMPAVSGMYKKKYCQGDFSHCARYMVFKSKGREFIPQDLFPNQQDRARTIMAT